MPKLEDIMILRSDIRRAATEVVDSTKGMDKVPSEERAKLYYEFDDFADVFAEKVLTAIEKQVK